MQRFVFAALLAALPGCADEPMGAPAHAPGEGPITIDNSADPFSIDASDGSPLIAIDDIRSYDWETHTITLMPGVRERLREALAGDLVRGHPFNVVANGQTFYAGNLTTSHSSNALESVVIDLNPIDDTLTADQVRIELGYPSGNWFSGDDPRNADGIREALRMSNKLKDQQSRTPTGTHNNAPGPQSPTSLPDRLTP